MKVLASPQSVCKVFYTIIVFLLKKLAASLLVSNRTILMTTVKSVFKEIIIPLSWYGIQVIDYREIRPIIIYVEWQTQRLSVDRQVVVWCPRG